MGNPVVHFEVVGKDGKGLKDFYGQLFAWKIDSSNPMDYGVVETGGIAGGIAGGSDEESSRVTFYVEVDDLQAKLDQVEKLGGRIVVPVSDIPGGPTIAMFHDPEGHLIGMVKAGYYAAS